MPHDLRLGFACVWDRDPRSTWSGTPWRLLQALRTRAQVEDLGPHLSKRTRSVLRLCYARRADGRWTSPWAHGRWVEMIAQHEISRGAAELNAVIEIQDLATLDQPYWLVQDLSYDVLDELEDEGVVQLQFAGMSARWLRRKRDHQRQVYAAASGFFPMSEWLGHRLVELSGVARDRVTVVRPGASSMGDVSAPRVVSDGPPRLLFVGRDFARKGGDIVVNAHRALREDYDRHIELTICGPAAWPLPDPPGDGVTFVGVQSAGQVSALFETHDLFVLPSRFEAFGIVFLEALAHGIPCIGRDAYAMPEIVQPDMNGDLVESDDVDELVRAIIRVLENVEMRQRLAETREQIAQELSWETAADRMLAVIDRSVERG